MTAILNQNGARFFLWMQEGKVVRWTEGGCSSNRPEVLLCPAPGTEGFLRQAQEDPCLVPARALRHLRRCLWAMTALLLGSLLSCALLWQRKERQAAELDRLRQAFAALQDLRTEEQTRHQEVATRLDVRLEALQPYLTDAFPLHVGSSKELENMLSDRRVLLESVGMLFAIYHPGFVCELEQAGLTELEIGYCSFFALGFKGKEVSDRLGRNNFYKTNTRIRKKLGLGVHDTNLGNYVVALFERTRQDGGEQSIS